MTEPYKAKPFDEPEPKVTRTDPGQFNPEKYKVIRNGNEYIDRAALAAAKAAHEGQKRSFEDEERRIAPLHEAWVARKGIHDRDESEKERLDRERLNAPGLADEAEKARQRKATENYQKTWQSDAMAFAKPGGIAVGGLLGAPQGYAMGKALQGPLTNYGLEEGVKAFQGRPGRRAVAGGLPALYGLGNLAKAWQLNNDMDDPKATPFGRDANEFWRNYFIGQGVTAGLTGGLYGGLKDYGHENSTSGGKAPAPSGNGGGGGGESEGTLKPEEVKGLKGSGKPPKEGVGDSLLKALGVTPGPSYAANKQTLDTILAGRPMSDVNALAKASNHGTAQALLDAIKKRQKFMLPLAIGAGALGLTSDEAQAPPRDEAWPERPIDPFLRTVKRYAPTPEDLHHWLPPVAAADIGTAAGEAVKGAMNAPEPSVVEKPKPRIDPRMLVPSLENSTNVNAAKAEDERQRREGRPEIGSEARTATPQSTAVQQALRAAGDVAGRAPAEAAYKSDVKAIEPEEVSPSPAPKPKSTPKPQDESDAQAQKDKMAYNWLTHQAHLKHQASLAGGEPYDDYEDRIKHLQAAGLA